MTYVKTLIKNQRFSIDNLQPGITMANIVLQRMLGAPFVWRENRANISQAITTTGGTDYVVVISNLGRIETQWLTDANQNSIALEGAVSLPKVSTTRRPLKVAPVYDDNEGNITLRFDAIPDQNYTAYFDYQKKAPLLTSYAATFEPVSDEFGYLFNTGMLAFRARNDRLLPVMAMIVAPICLSAGMIKLSSSVVPLLERHITTSSWLTIPRSP